MAGGVRFDVTIVGEINLDLILYGLPGEMPEERELIARDFAVTLGSSSAILAHNLARLGLGVGFVTRVGNDELGRIALARLAASKVNVEQTQFADDVQTGVTVLLPHAGGRHILTYPGAMEQMRVADLDVAYLRSSRHFHFSSLFLQKRMHAGLPQLFRGLREAGLTVSLDTNDDPEDRWAGVLDELLDAIDILLPNEDEIKRMTGRSTVEEALNVLSERIPLIAVKCGSRGAMVQRGRERATAAPVAVQPVDTIGAGDSFNAGFLKGFLAGKPPAICATMGNVTAALSTLRAGGTEAYRDEVLMQQFLDAHMPVD